MNGQVSIEANKPDEAGQELSELGAPDFEGGDQANSSKLSRSWAKASKTESARNKREAKKLQKYDSNSIDEEEFQDCKLEYWLILIC